jgi:hypothetical protein
MYAVGVTTTHQAAAEALWETGADEVIPSFVGYDVDLLIIRLAARSERRPESLRSSARVRRSRPI